MAIWGWQTPQLPKNRKALNQNLKKKGEIVVMSGEVKLGEADYTVFWKTLLFILCHISHVKYPGKGLLLPTAFSRLFDVGKCEKHSSQMFFCEYDKTRDLC